MIRSVLRRLLKFVLILFAISIALVLIYRFVPPPATPLMLIRCVEQLANGKKVKLSKDWVSIDDISPNLVLAVIASEDNNFTTHFGFDFDAIKKAAEHNDKKGTKKIKGASTISQQTAKNVFLWPGRTWVRKGVEAYFTLLIEIIWSKKRIMEMYLNEIEMGDGIYGAEAASQRFFRKHASQLSRGEAALIAAVLPNPRKWSPVIPTAYLYRRQAWIMWNMNNIEKVQL